MSDVDYVKAAELLMARVDDLREQLQAKSALFDEMVGALEAMVYCEIPGKECPTCPASETCTGDPSGVAKAILDKAKEQL
jgi:hypothetical protein